MGAPLTITFTTGPGGVLTSASIDGSGNTATVSPNRVTFNTDPAGSGVKVSIKSKSNTQSINARVDSLAKFEDPAGGTWAGVVFGDANLVPAVQDIVKYHITDTAGDGTGDPTLAIDPPTVNDGSTAVVSPSVLKVGEEGQKTSFGQVVFTSGDKTQSRTLTIAVSVRTFIPEADDDETSTSVSATPPAPITVASLRITLSGNKALPQDLATLSAAGPQTYSTFLCDSTPALFKYTVGTDGTLTLDMASVTPATTDAKSDGNKIDVRWPTGERVRLQSKVNGTQVTIQVRERIRCKGAPDPTITGATVVPRGGDHHGGGHNGKGGDD
jgi:hypothetical protein